MPRLRAANNAITTLVSAINASQTSFTVADASLFPDPPFRITVDSEIMEVGAVDRVNNVFSSVQRGIEGTTAASHAAGALVTNTWTAGTYAELASTEEVNSAIQSHVNATDPHTQYAKAVDLTAHLADTAIHQTAEQIRKAADKSIVVEVSSSAPSSPVNGQIWYDSTNHKFRGYANGAWV